MLVVAQYFPILLMKLTQVMESVTLIAQNNIDKFNKGIGVGRVGFKTLKEMVYRTASFANRDFGKLGEIFKHESYRKQLDFKKKSS